MLRYDLYSMQILASVAETRSFAKTAALVHLTPSAVSKRIAELEARSGAQLVLRTPFGVEISAAGQAVVRSTREILQQMGVMAREVAIASEGQVGEVKVVSNASGLLLGLAEDLKAFRQAYPQVNIRVEERLSGEAIDDVESARADIGICAMHVDRRGLSAVVYRCTDLVAAVHEDHPLAGRVRVSYREIAEFPQIGRPFGSMLPFNPPDDYPPVRPFKGLESSARSFDAVIALVRANVGIAVLPAASLETRPGGVYAIPLEDDWAKFQLMACHDPLLLGNPAAMLVVDWLAKASSSAP